MSCNDRRVPASANVSTQSTGRPKASGLCLRRSPCDIRQFVVTDKRSGQRLVPTSRPCRLRCSAPVIRASTIDVPTQPNGQCPLRSGRRVVKDLSSGAEVGESHWCKFQETLLWENS